MLTVQAYTMAMQTRRYTHIMSRVKGIVFLATPHDAAGSLVTKSAGLLGLRPSRGKLSKLLLDLNAQALDSINHDFEAWASTIPVASSVRAGRPPFDHPICSSSSTW